MMFLFHIAFALGLLALGAGVYFILWGYDRYDRKDIGGVGLAKGFGWIILILAIITLLCTFYYNMKLWRAGYYMVAPRVMVITRQPTVSQPMMLQKMQMQKTMIRPKPQSSNANPNQLRANQSRATAAQQQRHRANQNAAKASLKTAQAPASSNSSQQ